MLMADSTADSEENSTDGSARFTKRLRPLGAQIRLSLGRLFRCRFPRFESALEKDGYFD
jgi:hypothetical protein